MKQRCRAIEQMVLATSDPEERFRIYVRGELNEWKVYERQRHFRRGKK